MIQPLRRRHRQIFMLLGFTLPVVLIVGFATHPPLPAATGLPPVLTTTAPAFSTGVWQQRDGLFAKVPVQVRWLRAPDGIGGFALNLTGPKDFLKPDLLVYWVSGQPGITDTLPADARLLGAFSAGTLPLPAEAARGPGVLVLYSLADNEIVAVSRPVQLNDTTR